MAVLNPPLSLSLLSHPGSEGGGNPILSSQGVHPQFSSKITPTFLFYEQENERVTQREREREKKIKI